MVADWLQNLLILQDRDSRCDGIRQKLDAIPDEIAAEQSNISKLKSQVSEREEGIKSLEVRRLDMEGEVEQTEANIVKYKTQQMQVKKNEEYAALEKEIETLKQKISELEDEELLLLEEIDQEKAMLDKVRADSEKQCQTLEAHIELLKKNHAACGNELEDAKQAVSDAETVLETDILKQYRYVKGQVKRPPVVVELNDGRCQGCHLKVSGEVESEARKGKALARCDSCGRILYFDR